MTKFSATSLALRSDYFVEQYQYLKRLTRPACLILSRQRIADPAEGRTSGDARPTRLKAALASDKVQTETEPPAKPLRNLCPRYPHLKLKVLEHSISIYTYTYILYYIFLHQRQTTPRTQHPPRLKIREIRVTCPPFTRHSVWRACRRNPRPSASKKP